MKKLDLYAYSFQKGVYIYKIYFDKTKCMYFMVKDDQLKIWEKVSNIIKKIDSELIHNKKNLKAKKNSTQKKAFNVFIYQQY